MHVQLAVGPSSEQTALLAKTTTSEQTLPDGPGLTQSQGYLLMFFSAVFEAVREFLVRIIETALQFPPSTSLIMSAIVYVTLSTIYLIRFNLFKTSAMPLGQLVRLGIRGFCAAYSVYLSNVAIARIPVGLVLTLFATAPSITTVLAVIFLSEPFTRSDFGILVLNILGVSLVTRPTALGSHPEAVFGVVATLMATVIASAGFVILRSMGQHVHFMLHIFSIGVSSSLICLLVVDMNDINAIRSSATGTTIAVTTGFLGFFLKVCVNSGMQVTRPGPALVIRSAGVPLGFLLGLIFLSERLTLIPAIGAMLVLSSVACIGIKETLDNQTNA